MKQPKLRILVLSLLAVVLPPLAGTEMAVAEIISRVEVVGAERVEPQTVLLQTKSRAGTAFSPEQVSADIKQIFRTGYFENVDAEVARSGAAIVLQYRVKEKPAIRNVFLEGNDALSDDTLKEKLDIGARRFLDRRKIRAALESVRVHYQSLGYYDATLDFREAEVPNNEVDLTIDIHEGEKVYIREIEFEGNHGIDDDDLFDVIRSRSYNWWITWLTGRGVYKKETVDADSKELMHLYLNRGYVDARIPDPDVSRTEDGLKVTYKITEGDVYALGDVKASGDLIENSAEKTLEGIKAKSGETFSADTLRDDTFKVSEKFTDIGYAFANVTPDTNINRSAKTVSIDFQIDKGKATTVDRITLVGNQKTSDNVIRRSLQIDEQDQYSSSKVRRSQELLQRLGYFDEVTITPEPSAEEGKVDLSVGVREANTGSFSVGAGISSGDGVIFSSQITENNIFGSGNSVSADVSKGTKRDTYILSFTNPRVNDSYLSLGVEGSAFERIYDDFSRKQAGGSVTAGYPLWFLGPESLEDVRASVSYELMHIDINDIDPLSPQLILDSAGSSVNSSITPKIVRNTINNPLDPSAGSKQIVALELAGLGGDEKFWLGQASNSFYYDLLDTSFGNFVFAQRTRLDWGESYDSDPFPLFRRFFPGGINSVRGYEAREMGPKENGREFGGNKQLVANFELLFPLVNSIGLKGLAFYDAGEAFDDSQSVDIGELRQAVGWGIRWRSPIAPIRIEFGYPIDKQDGDSSVVTNFSFGAPL